jgi:glycosyltransferase involved in cell wall biosynthesis
VAERRISIVISSYNYGRFLRRCVDSALDQVYENFEVIVVDDGSSDDSLAILESYSERI